MKKVYIDIETFSVLSLKDVGVYVYAEHQSTEILCISYAVNDGPIKVVKTILGEGVPDEIKSADKYIAHNISFERTLLKHVLGWDIPLEKWSCTLARAASIALPRSLDAVSKALGVPVEKDKDGHRVMMQLCKPRRGRNKPWEYETYKAKYDKLFSYCGIDVEVCRGVDRRIGELPPRERRVWEVDQIINERGVYIDVESASRVAAMVDEYKEEMERECVDKFGVSPTQRGEIFKRMEGKLENLRAPTVTEALESGELDLTEEQMALLRYRQRSSLTSLAKYNKFYIATNEDRRLRGMTIYCGASTGRWAGKLVQLHNLPRGGSVDSETVFEAVKVGGIELLDFLYGDITDTLKQCIRGIVTAPKGKELILCDYNAIEARVRVWLTGEEDTLEVFRSGRKLYEHTASKIFKKKIEDITPHERSIGKVAELALGYQGAVGAFTAMCTANDMDLEEDFILSIVKSWRAANRNTVNFWYALERAFKQSVKTYSIQTCGRLKIASNSTCSQIRLPSGRILTYWNPKVDDTLSYFGLHSQSSRWMRIDTYGGKLFENVVQAIARDLLAHALVKVEDKWPGFISVHVHDEIVGETDGSITVKEVGDIMCDLPSWASGLPIAAKGVQVKRFQKG